METHGAPGEEALSWAMMTNSLSNNVTDNFYVVASTLIVIAYLAYFVLR